MKLRLIHVKGKKLELQDWGCCTLCSWQTNFVEDPVTCFRIMSIFHMQNVGIVCQFVLPSFDDSWFIMKIGHSLEGLVDGSWNWQIVLSSSCVLKDFNYYLQKMSSLVERLRVRSDRRPVYNLDESDDDDLLPKKPGTVLENMERIVRSDAVCCFIF